MSSFNSIISKLETEHSLSLEEYKYIIENYSPAHADFLSSKADLARRQIYGNHIYIRGLIEFSSICKNDCYYCGIRKSNTSCCRYRLDANQILECCKRGYNLGFRTFVLQSGEDKFFSDDFLCNIIKQIKSLYPDCAITLSLGERSLESYQELYDAGADRYLLRQETSSKSHYNMLHPTSMSFENRMACLSNLKNIGYKVGCGFMVGTPFQTSLHIAQDLKFIEEFRPHMCGIGPFIPHASTCFKDYSPGSVHMTCYLLSILRLIDPHILLPATTALATLHPDGREMGIRSGANVIMPNLTPANVRENYKIYNNKLTTGMEDSAQLDIIKQHIKSIGYDITVTRGDNIY